MTITGQSALGKDDIDRMVRDAESHAEDDRRRREEAEVRNQADSLVYQTEKMLKDQAASFSGDQKAKVESAVSDLRTALKGDDRGAIEKKTEALAQASGAIAQRAYAEQQGGAAGPEAAAGAAGGGGGAGKDDVVDAEFEEVKDKGRKAS